MTLYDQFIKDVKSGKLLSNLKVKQSVDRHLDDLENLEGHYFDRDEADRAIAFIKMLRHTKGEWRGQLFDLQPFQGFIVAMIFGWKKDDGYRRFTKAYIEMARKNGKSELASAISLYCFLMDNEGGAEIYTLGTKYAQAKIVFDLAKSMVRMLKKDSATMDKMISTLKYNLNVIDTESKFEALSSDSEKQDGLNPHCAIADELHAWKDGTLYKVIETGQGARLQPLLLSITTAGFNKQSFCYSLRGVCSAILSGTMKDETFFSIIFTLDDDDDFADESVWTKANPNIGNAPYWDYMRAKFHTAVNEGEVALIEFKTKNLNIWTSTGSTWIQDSDYQKIITEINEDDLIGRKCVGGLDISSSDDLTAFVLTFYPDDNDPKFKTLAWFFCPEDKINSRRRVDEVDYVQWERDGWIIGTPGNVLDQEFVLHFISQKAEMFNLEYVEVDPWNAIQLIVRMNEIGITAEKYPQNMQKMGPATKELGLKIMGEQIEIHDNPIMRWMMQNIELVIDTYGNFRINKGKKKDKVDGPVAWVMSIGGILHPAESNDYHGDGPMVL